LKSLSIGLNSTEGYDVKGVNTIAKYACQKLQDLGKNYDYINIMSKNTSRIFYIFPVSTYFKISGSCDEFIETNTQNIP
jgi:hypothetical protein